MTNPSSETALWYLIEKDTDGILVVDQEGIVRFANPAAHSILHRTAGDFVGKPFGFSLGQEDSMEVTVPISEKEAHNVELRISAIDWEGKQARLVSIRDITEIVQARELLAVEKKQLVELSETKSRFVADASHELRTPLAIIREFVSLVHDEVVGPLNIKKQKDCLVSALRNCDRLAELINRMLDLSKIEADKIEINRVKTDAAPLITELYNDFLPRCRSKKQNLLLELPSKLPEVHYDINNIRTVLTNLLSNAQKFTPENGTINVGAQVSGKFVSIYVKDNGPGIPEESHAAVFEPFVQINREYGPGMKGTGLGLAIAKKLVEMNHGCISLESSPGKGCCFTFTIPVYEQTPSRRVLIVDDDELVIRTVSRFLKRPDLNLELKSTTNALDALVIAGAFNPELLILDVHLVEISGEQVLASLRKKRLEKSLKILLISGDSEAMKRMMEHEADDCLPKPFSSQDFIRKVVKLLGIERRKE